MKIQKTEYVPLPMGEYSAIVSDVTAETGQFGPQVKFRFELTQKNFEGKTLLGWCSATYSPKSKLWVWAKAMLGTNPAEFDSDQVIGRQVRLAVLARLGEDGQVHNKVDGLLPMPF